MRHFIHERKVRRYARFGTTTTLVGLGLMIVSIVLAFTRQDLGMIVILFSLSGLTIFQVGQGFRNRWSRHPRMDELLDAALKGLDDRYAIFHYCLGASHTLASPHGVFALCTSDIEGDIHYQDGRWLRLRPRRGRRGGLARQTLPDPSKQTQAEAARTERALERRLDQKPELAIQSVLVFVHEGAQLHAEEAPVPSIHLKKIKGYLRDLPRGRTLTSEQVQTLAASLGF